MTRTTKLLSSCSLALAAVFVVGPALADGAPPIASGQSSWSIPPLSSAQQPVTAAQPAAATAAGSSAPVGGAAAQRAANETDPTRSGQSIKVTLESTQSGNGSAAAADRAQEAPRPKSPDDSKFLHGFRLGYSYTFNYDKPVPQFGDGSATTCGDPTRPGACTSLKDKVGLKAPDHLLLGYEVIYRVVGQSWLNVLLVGNVNIAGLEQSKVLPTGNLLVGFEFNNSFQVGIGANLAPLKGAEAHAIVAAGWTPKVGTLYTPLHVFFVPDADGVHRLGVTTGVTF
jgi:hypothetical protein